MNLRFLVPVAAILVVFAPTESAAQLLSVTGRAGFYVPVGDYDDVEANADELIREREGTFAFGGAINLDPPLSPFGVRVSADYVTGSTLSRGGVTGGSENEGDAKTLYLAGDLILTPLPRLLVLQPYVAAGAGYRHTSFDVQDRPEITDGDLVGHLGLGVDVGLGGIGLVAEISDYIARGSDGGPAVENDFFVTAGLKIPLF